MLRTYKFRIYPTKSQVKNLETTLNLCRDLYNAGLQERRDAYKISKVSINYTEQQNQIPFIKKTNIEYENIYSQVLQDVLRRLDKSFKNFFQRVKNKENKVGFPRFQGVNRYNSFTYTQSGFRIDSNKLYLSKLGHFKLKQHREIDGTIKTLTVGKSSTNKWYACFSCEVEKKILDKTNKSVGIDVGLKKFCTISDGVKIINPKFFRQEEKNLAKVQRKLSKLNMDSKNYKKRKKIVSRVHERISNKRTNFIHQISNYLIKSYDLIIFEKLNIKNMIKNHKLSKSIQDVSWNQLINFTIYKAENADKSVKLVNPRNTSNTTNCCNIKLEISLSDRNITCPNCNKTICRDYNASLNILRLGLESFGLKSIEVTSL